MNAEFQRRTRRNKKAFLNEQCKEIEENKKWDRLRISLRKLEIPKEYFMQRWAQQKTETVYLTEAKDIKKRWKNMQKNYTKRS